MPLALLDAPPIEKPKPVQRYTGEILLRTRPKTYRKVVELLSHGRSVNSISKECRVSDHMVVAMRNREASTIEERKREMSMILTDVSYISAARVMDTVGKASCRDAAVATGISIDKTLALLGQSPAIQVANVIMPSEADRDERRALHDKLDAIAQRLATT